jgi:hypothetical protein
MKNIILTEEQLVLISEKFKKPVNERSDGSYMSRQQLFTIATLAKTMWEQLENGDQLEDWMESKIAQAEQSITSVVKSFMYDEITNKPKGIDLVDFDDIIIGQ